MRPLHFWRAGMRGKVMNWLSHCLLASALFAVGAARAQGEAGEPGTPINARPASVQTPSTAEPAKPKGNPILFAPASAATAKPLSVQQRDERQFLRDAAATRRFQSDASRLALSKSSNPGVRSVATTLIEHHAKSGNELLYLLQVRGMAPPMLANDQRKTLNRLGKLQGSKFDRAYMAEVAVKNQQQDVQTFERASANTRDPQLKAWIERMLPSRRYNITAGAQIAQPNVKLAKAASGGSASVKAPPRQVAAATSRDDTALSRVSLHGQAMSPGPSPLGLSRPIAAWAIGSNIR